MIDNKKIKVVVGISGGVDSAVSAFLLKQNKNYEVIGVFMQNWDSFVNNELNYSSNNDKCDAQIEYDDAKKVAQQLNINLYKVDFIKEYWEYVFNDFINKYKNGLTPNPDVLCNKYIKFGFFLDYCKQQFNCDYIATGHYAWVEHFNNYSVLKIPKDKSKDQTYFLCELNQEQLSKSLFPLWNLTKQEVRLIAKNNNLFNWDKKDSTGICFIGKRNFRSFLSNYIDIKKGNIVDIDNNEIIGEHLGIFFYTVGQNDGLGLGGKTCKYFVVKKDLKNNILYVCKQTDKDKYLISTSCIVNEFNFIIKPQKMNDLKVRFRHLQKLHDCKIEILKNKSIKIIYNDGSYAVACGQYAVVYENDICIGGGVINQVL